MALQALAVVGSHESWFENIFLVKGFAVAASTTRRFFRNRAVMVASLADRTLFHMKITRDVVFRYVFNQSLDDFPVGHIHGFVRVRQSFDNNLFRDLLGCKHGGNRGPGFDQPGSYHVCRCVIARRRHIRRGSHMAGFARGLVLFPDLSDGCMATGTAGILLVQLVAADAALPAAWLMHGLLQGDIFPFLVSGLGMAAAAGCQIGMVTDDAGVVGFFMGLVVEGNKTQSGSG